MHLPANAGLKILVMQSDILMNDIYWLKAIPKNFARPNVSVDVWEKPQVMAQVHLTHQNERFPSVTLWRLFAPYIYQNYDKLLYLDNDVLICDNVLPLFDMLPENKIMGVVNDFQSFINVGFPEKSVWSEVDNFAQYFNSGVLLIDPKRYTDAYSETTMVEAVNSASYTFLDQTLLNRLITDRVAYLPLQYNYQKDDEWLAGFAKQRNPQQAAKISVARKHVVIRHFVFTRPFSLPWEHGYIQDEFERDFWQTFYKVKMQ
ncbi:glycosyltransferase [Schleiferilactobacillus perolens DSM 12744]|uniref:Glycosyltransferase n=2 Tax=Schleiferilactobacillus perolens TaxID=100468 RepID=A0A0R1N2M2_9LACO|nr:glycosyltransferase [Schleiferilactobacillus perolens DSM 12744]